MINLAYATLAAAHILAALCLYLRHCRHLEKLWAMELLLLVICGGAYVYICQHYM